MASLKYGLEGSSFWLKLPEQVLLHLFSYLGVKPLLRASQTCKLWHRVAQDETLWKSQILSAWKLKQPYPWKALWKGTWQNLYREFYYHVPCIESELLKSHEDEVWNVSFSNNGQLFATASKDGSLKVWTTSHPCEMAYFKHIASEKNSSTYVQRSQFSPNDTKILVSLRFNRTIQGRIHVYAVKDNFPLLLDVVNEPSQSFGTWLTDYYILTGSSNDIDEFVDDRISTISLTEVPDEFQEEYIMADLFRFKGNNDSLIQKIMFAFPKTSSNSADLQTSACDRRDNFLNPPSPVIPRDMQNSPFYSKPLISFLHQNTANGDIYLIFRTSTIWFCYSHQIWIKRIDKNIVKELLERNSLDIDNEVLNTVDHQFEMKGFISDMNLSKDHRYLYVNCRKWSEDYTAEACEKSEQTLSNQFDICVIDLVNMENLGDLETRDRGKAVTECSLIDLDISQNYIASGAEDKQAYVWDLHHLACVAKLPHEDIVNSVAFNPTDPEMMVTVSDDRYTKVWRSRCRMRHIDEQKSLFHV